MNIDRSCLLVVSMKAYMKMIMRTSIGPLNFEFSDRNPTVRKSPWSPTIFILWNCNSKDSSNDVFELPTKHHWKVEVNFPDLAMVYLSMLTTSALSRHELFILGQNLNNYWLLLPGLNQIKDYHYPVHLFHCSSLVSWPEMKNS